MFLDAVFTLLTAISTGLCIYSEAIRRTSEGIVAENNNVCFSSGVVSKIESISSRNPMFNISSASSKTVHVISLIFNALRLIKSIVRPGVPTTICGLSFNPLICFTMSAPP